jgi:secreted PhoX family phosphatase
MFALYPTKEQRMQAAVDRGLTTEIDSDVRLRTSAIQTMIGQHEAEHGEVRRDGASASDVAPFVANEDGDAASGTRNAGPAIDRRTFLGSTAAVVSSVAIAGTLGLFHARKAEAKSWQDWHETNAYGDPVPTLDETTGLPLIGLPPGFRYWSFGWTGDAIFPGLTGGPVTPPMHDGMDVIKQVGPWAILCRNHEAGAGPAFVDGRLRYSPAAAGGNTNLIFDTHRAKWIAAWPTLSGTVRNCAGGGTDHHSWLSCEETGDTTMDAAGNAYTHGWCFDVPAVGTSNGTPIKAMGRRSHEAAAIDPRTSYVYLTEDTTPGGVYRFRPNRTRVWETPYSRGGQLEMLKIAGLPNANLRGTFPGGGAPYPKPVGRPLDVEWVPINDPENLAAPSNFAQGAALGGADFRRPEGAWYRDGVVFFVATDGGSTGNGQVFALDVKRQTLTLLYDAPLVNGSPSELDNPDNVTVTPRGSLLFCEDNAGNPSFLLDGVSTERLVALTPKGKIFTFATNLIDFSEGKIGPYTRPSGRTFTGNQRGNEWAGACFDRTGQWLFANIQTPGVTFAITGPWHQGPL